MVMALAAIAVPAVTADGRVELGEAVFQSGSISFPAGQDANYDHLNVGNDKAIAVQGAFRWFFGADPVAKNNLDIEKIQKSGEKCESCCMAEEHHGGCQGGVCASGEGGPEFGKSPDKCSACQNACSLINLEQLNVGSRQAIASGPNTLAENNVKIKTVQA